MNQSNPSFERDGFYILSHQIIPNQILTDARNGMAAVRDGDFDMGLAPTEHPGYDPGRLCKINNPHRSDRGLHGLVTCPELGSQVASITGSRWIQVWASQLLIKPPGSQSAGHVGWHQDRQYWGMWQEEEGLFTVWIALEDVGETSGPMRFVKRSHRWGFLNQGDFFNNSRAATRELISVPPEESWEEVSVLLPAGGISIHHCLTYHGSGPNTSSNARYSLAVHVRDERTQPVRGDDNYYTSHLDNRQICPMMHSAPPVPRGTALPGNSDTMP